MVVFQLPFSIVTTAVTTIPAGLIPCSERQTTTATSHWPQHQEIHDGSWVLAAITE